jgi:hypothetical protein
MISWAILIGVAADFVLRARAIWFETSSWTYWKLFRAPSFAVLRAR